MHKYGAALKMVPICDRINQLDQVHYDIHHENRAVWAVMKPYSARIDGIRFVKTI